MRGYERLEAKWGGVTRAYPACLGSDVDPVQTFIARRLFFDGPRRPKSQVLWGSAEFIHEIRLAADVGPDQEQTPQLFVTVRNHSVSGMRSSELEVGLERKRACCLTFGFFGRRSQTRVFTASQGSGHGWREISSRKVASSPQPRATIFVVPETHASAR